MHVDLPNMDEAEFERLRTAEGFRNRLTEKPPEPAPKAQKPFAIKPPDRDAPSLTRQATSPMVSGPGSGGGRRLLPSLSRSPTGKLGKVTPQPPDPEPVRARVAVQED